jgi:hypothetical protein
MGSYAILGPEAVLRIVLDETLLKIELSDT